MKMKSVCRVFTKLLSVSVIIYNKALYPDILSRNFESRFSPYLFLLNTDQKFADDAGYYDENYFGQTKAIIDQ